jgi:hypothetical protein
MTRGDFKKFLHRNSILMKEAAYDLGYDEQYFCTVINKKGNVPSYFMSHINNYAIIKAGDFQKRDFVESFWNEKELEIPHHNEWSKLKQTELFKQLKNGN